jgi:hypothetical protein
VGGGLDCVPGSWQGGAGRVVCGGKWCVFAGLVWTVVRKVRLLALFAYAWRSRSHMGVRRRIV